MHNVLIVPDENDRSWHNDYHLLYTMEELTNLLTCSFRLKSNEVNTHLKNCLTMCVRTLPYSNLSMLNCIIQVSVNVTSGTVVEFTDQITVM